MDIPALTVNHEVIQLVEPGLETADKYSITVYKSLETWRKENYWQSEISSSVLLTKTWKYFILNLGFAFRRFCF